MELGIRGRHAVVCCSSRGIGRACAEVLAVECGDVTLCARSPGPLAEAARAIRARGNVTVNEVVADLSTIQGARTLIGSVSRQTDILVLIAARQSEHGGTSLPAGAWANVLESGLLVPMELVQAFLPGMADRGFGRIVHVTGSAVKAPVSQFSLTNTLRAGLLGFLSGLARGSHASSVTINSILVGYIDTPGLRDLRTRRSAALGVSLTEYAQERAASTPAGRLGMPEEVASLCAYLSSAYAGFITGQAVLCDGGRTPYLV